MSNLKSRAELIFSEFREMASQNAIQPQKNQTFSGRIPTYMYIYKEFP
jgi:hypothetical protein